MKPKPTLALCLLIAAVAIGLLIARSKFSGREGGSDATAISPARPGAAQAGAFLQAAAAGLQQNSDSARNRQTLAELRAHLAALTKVEAVAAIRAALESGVDAPTRLDLKPGAAGTLADAPSLRVFLLDQLQALDAAAARELAKKILETFTTPDEWAMSLAVCAADTSAAGREFVQGKAREMAQHKPWQREPGAGFLEAFDVFVFTHDTEFAPQLAAFLGQTNNRALAHAAFLTLDRLAQSDTAATLNALAARPELLQDREATRAGYFARADVRDGEQRAVVERYLLNTALSADELEQFAGTFPNANFMVSQNLLTRPTTPDAAEISARDAAALNTVNQWLADPRFAKLNPSLTVIRARLEQFVKPAK